LDPPPQADKGSRAPTKHRESLPLRPMIPMATQMT
jgi:hypothetical protein